MRETNRRSGTRPIEGESSLAQLRRRVEAAKRLLESGASQRLFDALGLSPRLFAPPLGAALRLDHVGFLALPGEDAEREAALLKAGFGAGHIELESRLVARELEALVGVERIPTTIFKCFGHAESGAELAVELFVPETDPAIVEEWIEAGVASHVAIEVSGRRHFLEIARRLDALGIGMPFFMEGQPRYSNDEDVSMLFFTLPARAEFEWLEVRLPGDWTRPERSEILGLGRLAKNRSGSKR